MTFSLRSSLVKGAPAASWVLIASLNCLMASLYAAFLKCWLPRSLIAVNLSSSSFKALSCFVGSAAFPLGVSSVIIGSSTTLGCSTTLGYSTTLGCSVYLTVFYFCYYSSLICSSAVFMPSIAGRTSLSSVGGRYLMPSSCSMYFMHLW